MQKGKIGGNSAILGLNCAVKCPPATLRVEGVAPNAEKQPDTSPYETTFSSAGNFAGTELFRLKFSIPGVCLRLTFPFFQVSTEKGQWFPRTWLSYFARARGIVKVVLLRRQSNPLPLQEPATGRGVTLLPLACHKLWEMWIAFLHVRVEITISSLTTAAPLEKLL